MCATLCQSSPSFCPSPGASHTSKGNPVKHVTVALFRRAMGSQRGDPADSGGGHGRNGNTATGGPPQPAGLHQRCHSARSALLLTLVPT